MALVDMLPNIRPDLRIVLGGPEVSFDNELLFASHPGLTALVHGEGEMPLQTLLRAWTHDNKPSNTPRLTWRKGDSIEHGAEQVELLLDLDHPLRECTRKESAARRLG